MAFLSVFFASLGQTLIWLISEISARSQDRLIPKTLTTYECKCVLVMS